MSPRTADLSIVIPTVGRSSLLRAVQSVFRQTFPGTIQILIGMDADLYGEGARLREILTSSCPDNRFISWIDMGYSTSRRHGGVHRCHFGGALRTALSFLAQSAYVMYLDDDDWLAEPHCAEVMAVIGQDSWAFALSFYADGNLGEAICEDLLESVGVYRGLYKDDFGGFVRPSGLLLNKLQLPHLLHLWSESPLPSGDGEDRLVFNQLRDLPHGFTGRASVYYALDPNDRMHAARLAFMQGQGKTFPSLTKHERAR